MTRSKNLAFELLVLSRMDAVYQATVLKSVSLSAKEAESLKRGCAIDLPQGLTRSLDVYEAYLGAPDVSVVATSKQRSLIGNRQYRFGLELWPHLFWAVYEPPSGGLWEAGFINRKTLRREELSYLRAGDWTRPAIEEEADDAIVHDGWDDEVDVRFVFSQGAWEGRFVYGLLQRWRPAQNF